MKISTANVISLFLGVSTAISIIAKRFSQTEPHLSMWKKCFMLYCSKPKNLLRTLSEKVKWYSIQNGIPQHLSRCRMLSLYSSSSSFRCRSLPRKPNPQNQLGRTAINQTTILRLVMSKLSASTVTDTTSSQKIYSSFSQNKVSLLNHPMAKLHWIGISGWIYYVPKSRGFWLPINLKKLKCSAKIIPTTSNKQ